MGWKAIAGASAVVLVAGVTTVVMQTAPKNDAILVLGAESPTPDADTGTPSASPSASTSAAGSVTPAAPTSEPPRPNATPSAVWVPPHFTVSVSFAAEPSPAGEFTTVTVYVQGDRGALDTINIYSGDGSPHYDDGMTWEPTDPPYDSVGGTQCEPAGSTKPFEAEHSFQVAWRSAATWNVVADAVAAQVCPQGAFTQDYPSLHSRVTVPHQVTGATTATNGPWVPTFGAQTVVDGRLRMYYGCDDTQGEVCVFVDGQDRDGHLSVVDVDWGDGSPITHLSRARCDDPGARWPAGRFALTTGHDYLTTNGGQPPDGTSISVTVHTTGCDGGSEQYVTQAAGLGSEIPEDPPYDGS